MSKLVTRGSKYTDEQRIDAAVIYAAKGTFSAVIREKNIPKSTLSNWSKTDWWDEVVAEVRTEKSGEHRAMYTQIVDLAQEVTLDKLPDANAAQAHLIACQATDKVRLHDGMPTAITGKSEDMNSLAAEFKALSAKWDEKQVRVVSVQEETEEIK